MFAGWSGTFLVRPIRRQVSDSQVALYLEENDPTLEAAILSAIEATSGSVIADRITRRIWSTSSCEQAIEQCRAVQRGHHVDEQALKRYSMALGGVAVAALLLVIFGPAYLRHGLSALLVVTRAAEKSSPYPSKSSRATPRCRADRIRRSPRSWWASRSKDATLMVRNSQAAQFERMPLVAGANPAAFEGMLFHLDKGTEYYVESNGVEVADVHEVTVLDLPTVGKLELEYHFPAYTGLPVQKIDVGGDVAALRGTEVWMRITPTMTSPAGKIVVNEAGNDVLTKEAGWHAHRQVRRQRRGLLQDRTHRTARRAGQRVAEVHDRRPERSAAGRCRSPNPGATTPPARWKKYSSRRRPTTTSA